MSANTGNRSETFTIVESMNDHGATTVRSTTAHATYHLVAYADDSTRQTVSSLAAGESARLSLSRVGDRGNVWRAEDAIQQPNDATSGLTAGD
jgi:hypothetical protein